jgi:cytochrome d ubiquinol oxidase subunit I
LVIPILLSFPLGVQASSFTPTAWLGFLLLGFGILIHITLVNIVLGMSIIVPLTEYIAYKGKDTEMERLARRLFRYLALSDLVAGVFGTFVAVILAGFWPKLLYVFSTIFFGPLMISLIGIFASIPSIAIYWYGWERLPKRVHLGTGALMGLGALLVPAGFRVLFAFIGNPYSFGVFVSGSSVAGGINASTVLTNPIYITLLLHSWFGGLTMASLFAAGAFGWALKSKSIWRETGNNFRSREVSIKEKEGEEEEEEEEKVEILRETRYMKYLLRMGLVFLTIQTVLGVAYFFVLEKYVPYVYAAITGNVSIAAYDFEWVLVPFLGLVFLIWASAVYLFVISRRSRFAKPSRPACLILMLSTVGALPLGEAMNDASRAPYMILTGTAGLSANDFTNTAIPVTWPIAYAALFVGIFTISALLITLYVVFVQGSRRFSPERSALNSSLSFFFLSFLSFLSLPSSLLGFLLRLGKLIVAKAIDQVVVHHPCCLHVGVAYCRTHESKSPFDQLFAHCVGFRSSRWDFFDAFPSILLRLASNEPPDE